MSLLGGLILSSILAASASAPVPAAVEGTETSPQSSSESLTAPFSATVKTRVARVRLRPEDHSPEVGLLREGAGHRDRVSARLRCTARMGAARRRRCRQD